MFVGIECIEHLRADRLGLGKGAFGVEREVDHHDGVLLHDADQQDDADEAEEEPEEDTAVFDKGAMAEEDGNDLFDKAVKVVLRDKKCSTSYIQRRLSIGYNKAASLVERMEQEGIVGAANHVGKRAIIVGGREVNAEGDFEG